MRAMVLRRAGEPLALARLPAPRPGPADLRLEVEACGVCRTDVHIADGELAHPALPLVPGHQIVGRVLEFGSGVFGFEIGQRVGVPWLGNTCGQCSFCTGGQENLCDAAVFTGYTRDGGFAEQTIAAARYCFPLPETYSSLEAAPLLCAGLIGYRALRLAGDGERIGFYGFGSAAHLLAQIVRAQGRRLFAFTRAGDAAGQRFARALGAEWAGSSEERPPERLDAAILFAPVGALVPLALAAVRKGGRVVAAGIHMSEIPAFPYELLWGERTLCSVANLTRRDGEELLALAARTPLEVEVTAFPLERANEALEAIRRGTLHGSAVLDLSTLNERET